MISSIILSRNILIMLIMINRLMKMYSISIIQSVISVLSVISIMLWPTSSSLFSLYIIYIIIGYSISISSNIIGCYMCLVLDILIWICILYTRYYISTCSYIYILLFYVVNQIFFNSSDMITVSLLYEFQSIPLLLIINNISNKIVVYSKKGIGISNILLMLYSIISGLMLYSSFYYLYLISNSINLSYSINFINSILLCLILISGSMKLSIFPFHIWLGKVHVEAPTIGSIVLAGISLKTGFYIHYLFIYYFSIISSIFSYIFLLYIIFGIFICNINIFYQIDSKRWIALYSIIHMNLYYVILLIVFSSSLIFGIYYISILIYGMIGHSLISGGLFLIIGYIYDISSSKNLLNICSSILSQYILIILFLLLISNSSFPLFVLFIFEYLGFICISLFNIVLSFLLLILSSSNLLSSLYIYYKYFFSSYYSNIVVNTSYDLVLIILSIVIISYVIFMGISILLPISILVF